MATDRTKVDEIVDGLIAESLYGSGPRNIVGGGTGMGQPGGTQNLMLGGELMGSTAWPMSLPSSDEFGNVGELIQSQAVAGMGNMTSKKPAQLKTIGEMLDAVAAYGNQEITEGVLNLIEGVTSENFNLALRNLQQLDVLEEATETKLLPDELREALFNFMKMARESLTEGDAGTSIPAPESPGAINAGSTDDMELGDETTSF